MTNCNLILVSPMKSCNRFLDLKWVMASLIFNAVDVYRLAPAPPLNEHVESFWYYVDWSGNHDREHVLPDGTFELMFDLQEIPRKLFDGSKSNHYKSFRNGWISGVQSKFLVIDTLPESSMIGVHFKAGGAAAFLGHPASELKDNVVELDSIWGSGIWRCREQLLAAQTPVLEQLLLGKLRGNHRTNSEHKCVSWAINRYVTEPHVRTISSVSTQVGFTQKHFIELFRRQTGLTPKLFCRIRRFQQVLAEIQSRRAINWADIACSCGYFDQSHFIRDFLGFSGLNPSLYLNHVLEGEPRFTRSPSR